MSKELIDRLKEHAEMHSHLSAERPQQWANDLFDAAHMIADAQAEIADAQAEIAGLKTHAATMAAERDDLAKERDVLLIAHRAHEHTILASVAKIKELAKELADERAGRSGDNETILSLLDQLVEIKAGPWIGNCQNCGHEHEAPRVDESIKAQSEPVGYDAAITKEGKP